VVANRVVVAKEVFILMGVGYRIEVEDGRGFCGRKKKGGLNGMEWNGIKGLLYRMNELKRWARSWVKKKAQKNECGCR